MSKITKLQMTA